MDLQGDLMLLAHVVLYISMISLAMDAVSLAGGKVFTTYPKVYRMDSFLLRLGA